MVDRDNFCAYALHNVFMIRCWEPFIYWPLPHSTCFLLSGMNYDLFMPYFWVQFAPATIFSSFFTTFWIFNLLCWFLMSAFFQYAILAWIREALYYTFVYRYFASYFALPYSKAVGKSLRQNVFALSAHMFALSVFDISAFLYFFPAQIAFCSISLLCTLH